MVRSNTWVLCTIFIYILWDVGISITYIVSDLYILTVITIVFIIFIIFSKVTSLPLLPNTLNKPKLSSLTFATLTTSAFALKSVTLFLIAVGLVYVGVTHATVFGDYNVLNYDFILGKDSYLAALKGTADYLFLNSKDLFSFLINAVNQIKALQAEIAGLAAQIDALRGELENIQTPKPTYSFALGIVVMLIAFALLIVGFFFYAILAFLLPKFFKWLSPRYYGIALNWFRHSDGSLVKIIRIKPDLLKLTAIIVITGGVSGMSSGILANIFTQLMH